jgi:hypothetical protein
VQCRPSHRCPHRMPGPRSLCQGAASRVAATTSLFEATGPLGRRGEPPPPSPSVNIGRSRTRPSYDARATANVTAGTAARRVADERWRGAPSIGVEQRRLVGEDVHGQLDGEVETVRRLAGKSVNELGLGRWCPCPGLGRAEHEEGWLREVDLHVFAFS